MDSCSNLPKRDGCYARDDARNSKRWKCRTQEVDPLKPFKAIRIIFALERIIFAMKRIIFAMKRIIFALKSQENLSLCHWVCISDTAVSVRDHQTVDITNS